uniref:Thioredoxin n=1 Tax=Steinernema glaseri TaxID=37863 RepID=A0A1I7ZQ78_9BILA
MIPVVLYSSNNNRPQINALLVDWQIQSLPIYSIQYINGQDYVVYYDKEFTIISCWYKKIMKPVALS